MPHANWSVLVDVLPDLAAKGVYDRLYPLYRDLYTTQRWGVDF